MRRIAVFAWCLALWLVAVPRLRAQVTATPAFEIASVKPHAPDSARLGMGAIDVSRWSASGVTAKTLITEAYGVQNFQISGGPAWVDKDQFDVDAKVDDATAAELQKLPRQDRRQRIALMLQSLLSDRFKLHVTQGTKEGQVFTLTIAKGGPKVKEATPGKNAASFYMQNGLTTMKVEGTTLTGLVGVLAYQLGHPVIDRTGLAGKYDFTLTYEPIQLSANPSAANADGETIFAALEDQLGLKLESVKGPIETITIDHIEEPSPN